jgi:hypothetical protein
MARSRWAWIREEAERCLLLTGAQRPDQIDALALAKRLDIEVTCGAITGATERITTTGNRVRIRISDAIVQAGRRSFTTAHAIGHAICGHAIPIDGDVEGWIAAACASRGTREERECDVFATEYLTPTSWVAPYCAVPVVDPGAVRTIASTFRVSPVMAAIRFAELTHHACAIVYAERGIVVWSRGSRTFPSRIQPGTRVPDGSIARAFFDQHVISDGARHLGARAWLRSSAKITSTTEIIEHAEVVPEPGWGGVLSLLWLPRLPQAAIAAAAA